MVRQSTPHATTRGRVDRARGRVENQHRGVAHRRGRERDAARPKRPTRKGASPRASKTIRRSVTRSNPRCVGFLHLRDFRRDRRRRATSRATRAGCLAPRNAATSARCSTGVASRRRSASSRRHAPTPAAASAATPPLRADAARVREERVSRKGSIPAAHRASASFPNRANPPRTRFRRVPPRTTHVRRAADARVARRFAIVAKLRKSRRGDAARRERERGSVERGRRLDVVSGSSPNDPVDTRLANRLDAFALGGDEGRRRGRRGRRGVRRGGEHRARGRSLAESSPRRRLRGDERDAPRDGAAHRARRAERRRVRRDRLGNNRRDGRSRPLSSLNARHTTMCAFSSAAYDGTIADAAKCHLRFAVESSSMDATTRRRRNAKKTRKKCICDDVVGDALVSSWRNETTYASANDEGIGREKRREHRGRRRGIPRRDAHRSRSRDRRRARGKFRTSRPPRTSPPSNSKRETRQRERETRRRDAFGDGGGDGGGERTRTSRWEPRSPRGTTTPRPEASPAEGSPPPSMRRRAERPPGTSVSIKVAFPVPAAAAARANAVWNAETTRREDVHVREWVVHDARGDASRAEIRVAETHEPRAGERVRGFRRFRRRFRHPPRARRRTDPHRRTRDA